MRTSVTMIGFGLRNATAAAVSLVLCSACHEGPLVDPAAQVAFEVNVADSAPKLTRFRKRLAANGTDSLLVVQHNKIVHEWYARPQDSTTPHYTASLAKSLVGGITLALALDRGWLGVETPVAEFYAPWANDPQRSRITVGELAAHASGLADAAVAGVEREDLVGWQRDFWRRESPRDPVTLALTEVPLEFEPGTRFGYSNPGFAVLAFTLAAAAQRAGETDLIAALHRDVLTPAGIPRAAWSVGYHQEFTVDGIDTVANWGGAAYTARAAARIGQFFLSGTPQEWTALSAQALRTTTTPSGFPIDEVTSGPSPLTSFGWFLNGNLAFKSLPADALIGAGAGHQLLLVIPSMELVAVRYGNVLGPTAQSPFWRAAEDEFFAPLMRALRRPDLPPSRAIGAVQFGREIVCRAASSDNWPITWAADDRLYTSYGDGWGFEPRVETKLSLGLATLTGDAHTYVAQNLRSADAERTGDGRAGAKASGLLALDSTLYMWVRNLDNSQLAWSEDDGEHWTWGFKFEHSFGSPSFLNFGKNHAGAPDDWVYTFSQDGPSAYAPADGLVLARAPRDRLRQRESWEFFAGFDEQQNPRWSSEIRHREAVLRNPDAVARVDVVYHAGFERYLMALGDNLEGGWGLFDAPAPWGPWTLVFHTPDWGLGATHSYRIPSKWISTETRELALVFSGRRFEDRSFDGFCVRSVTLAAVGER